MAFRFGFGDTKPSKAASIGQPSLSDTSIALDTGTTAPVEEAKEVLAEQALDSPVHREIACGTAIVVKVVKLDLEALNYQEDQNSDLVPTVYEGGLKLWECSLDLAAFLETFDVNGKIVLEAGCGVAVPGIVCQQRGATVHYQDYNERVLKCITAPNVELNTETRAAARYFAGDWGDLPKGPMHGLQYDVVLASETIYSRDSMLKFYDFLTAVTSKPHGTVLLATKTYYFGVGGGAREFEELVASRGDFTCKTVFVHPTGVKREILQLHRKAGPSDAQNLDDLLQGLLKVLDRVYIMDKEYSKARPCASITAANNRLVLKPQEGIDSALGEIFSAQVEVDVPMVEFAKPHGSRHPHDHEQTIQQAFGNNWQRLDAYGGEGTSVSLCMVDEVSVGDPDLTYLVNGLKSLFEERRVLVDLDHCQQAIHALMGFRCQANPEKPVLLFVFDL